MESVNSSRMDPVAGAGATDPEIVARVVAGDVAVFEILMRRHNPRVYRTIRAILRDEAEVEDAMQQTYLLAYSHLRSFAGASSFATWLTRIAVNEALGRRRRSVGLVPIQHLDSEDPTMPSRSTPEDDAAHGETIRLLERAIDRLPLGHRTVLMLRDVEQLSTEEVASVLGISQEAVRIRLHRARRALRAAWYDQVEEQAPAAFAFHAPRCDRVVAAVMQRLGSVR